MSLLLSLLTSAGPHTISLNGVASTAATGTLALRGTIALTGGASVAAAGTIALRGTIALVGGASVSAAGAPKVNATLKLDGGPSVAATGTIALRGTIALAGVASVAATGTIALRGTIKLNGVASAAAAGVPTIGTVVVPPPVFQTESGAGAWPDFPRARTTRRIEPHVITLFGDSADNAAGFVAVRPQRMRVVRERELLMLEEA